VRSRSPPSSSAPLHVSVCVIHTRSFAGFRKSSGSGSAPPPHMPIPTRAVRPRDRASVIRFDSEIASQFRDRASVPRSHLSSDIAPQSGFRDSASVPRSCSRRLAPGRPAAAARPALNEGRARWRSGSSFRVGPAGRVGGRGGRGGGGAVQETSGKPSPERRCMCQMISAASAAVAVARVGTA
jgi:hypothetical protein